MGREAGDIHIHMHMGGCQNYGIDITNIMRDNGKENGIYYSILGLY